MNILLSRNSQPHATQLPRSVVNLARKLQCAATGHYPSEPAMLFRTLAQTIASQGDVRHSIAASLCELEYPA